MRRKQAKPTQPKIYDAAYKKLFSNRTIFRQLMALAAPLHIETLLEVLALPAN